MADLKQDLEGLRIERAPERPSIGRWVGWTLFLIVLATGAFAGWRWVTRERPIEVQVATVTERAVGAQAAVLNASGYVTARRRATVSSKITGKVVEVNVEEGMAVKEGDVLARLDDSTVRAALALAEAQAEASRQSMAENEVRLAEARVTLGRLNQLLKDRIVGQAEVDTAKANADSIEARINSIRQQVRVAESQIALQKTDLDNTVIRAPFSGVAISKDAQPGEMVSPVSAGGGFTRTGICTIVDMRSLEVEVDVNEAYIGRVTRGQNVTAVLDAYPDWQIPARVITMVPTADRQKATVLVRIGFARLDPRILPDMGIKVTFLRAASAKASARRGEAPASPDEAERSRELDPLPSSQPTLLVPKVAVLTENTQTFVFVVRGEMVERRAVRVGGADGDRLEVIAGLQSGDRVVVSPPANMKDGALIVVK